MIAFEERFVMLVTLSFQKSPGFYFGIIFLTSYIKSNFLEKFHLIRKIKFVLT